MVRAIPTKAFGAEQLSCPPTNGALFGSKAVRAFVCCTVGCAVSAVVAKSVFARPACVGRVGLLADGAIERVGGLNSWCFLLEGLDGLGGGSRVPFGG